MLRGESTWRSFLPDCAAVVVRYDGVPMALDTGGSVMDGRKMTMGYQIDVR